MSQALHELAEKYERRFQRGDAPLPRIIHVETRSKCNGPCDFCPASVQHGQDREDVLMDEGLVDKILEELASLGYNNRLSFYNNNEPFLDKRVVDFVRKARKKLPLAYLELKSNGILLNVDKVLEAFDAGLDNLYINNYAAGEMSKNVQTIRDTVFASRRFRAPDGRVQGGRITVTHRDPHEVIGSRAGNSPNKQSVKAPEKPCLRPCEMMTVGSQGQVSVCSEDFFYGMSLWNAGQDSLLDIWTSKSWNDVRMALLAGKRSEFKECSGCDYKGCSEEIFLENNMVPPGSRPSFLARALNRLGWL